MLLRSFDEMLVAYGITVLEESDQTDRSAMLIRLPNSVLFEGEYCEYDSIQNWYRQNISPVPIPFLFYGKLDYDYGFFELFFADPVIARRISALIPGFYSIYPNGKRMRTAGYETLIELNE
ncbi:MAG: hypothetical protein QM781_00200 [Chitinophagaceae bacterium]